MTTYEGHWWRRRTSTSEGTRWRLVIRDGEVDDGFSSVDEQEVVTGRFAYRGVEYPLRRLDGDAERAAYAEQFTDWP